MGPMTKGCLVPVFGDLEAATPSTVARIDKQDLLRCLWENAFSIPQVEVVLPPLQFVYTFLR